MRKFVIILIAIFFTPQLRSQESPDNLAVLSLVPQYLIIKGIRLDLDKQMTAKQFLQFCPQFYYRTGRGDENSNTFRDYDDLIGGGLIIYHKIFASENIMENGLYLSYGLSYNYFNLQRSQWVANESVRVTGHVNKVGGDLLIGYQYISTTHLSVDFYLGYGIRYSILNSDEGDDNDYNFLPWDYNYSGNFLQLGIRIGFVL